jgi:hypothetical protein
MNLKTILKRTICIGTVAVCLSACGSVKDKAGGELIEKAREEYTSLDSAKVIMTNVETGEVEQTFTFKYDEKDILIYSYYGKSEKSEFAQYNNGSESFTYENGEYTHSVKTDSDFVRYVRASTYPQADEGLLIYEPKYITEDSAVENSDGSVEYTHVYDITKIAAEAEDGEVTGFTVKYLFDKDGELVNFTEITDTESGGEKKQYSYRVEITEKNSVKDVENTTEQYKDKSE